MTAILALRLFVTSDRASLWHCAISEAGTAVGCEADRCAIALSEEI